MNLHAGWCHILLESGSIDIRTERGVRRRAGYTCTCSHGRCWAIGLRSLAEHLASLRQLDTFPILTTYWVVAFRVGHCLRRSSMRDLWTKGQDCQWYGENDHHYQCNHR